jgi:glycosyltransferase involved in cell wall biosynthesis
MTVEIPLVSICMITYNHEAYIAKAIEGILMQRTSFKYRLIIGEDHGTDKTRQICEDYSLRYPDKIELLPSEKNLGMMHNFIRTLKSCNGKYIALCEGDDYWTDPLKLQKQVDFLEANPEYTLSFTQNEIYEESLKSLKQGCICNKINYTTSDLLAGYNFIPTATVVFKRDAVLPLHHSFLQYTMGDWPLNIIASTKGKINCIPENTAVYRIHNNNMWINHSPIKQRKKSIDFLMNFANYYPELETLIFERVKEIQNEIEVISNNNKKHNKNNVWKIIKDLFR